MSYPDHIRITDESKMRAEAEWLRNVTPTK